MPRPRTPPGKEYMGHGKSAAQQAADIFRKTSLTPRQPAQTASCPPERTLMLEFRSEADRDQYHAWLTELHNPERTDGCDFCA